MCEDGTVTAATGPQLTAPEPGPRYDPAEYRPGSMEWLAACILEERAWNCRAGAGRGVPWYMLNLKHPALSELMTQYKAEHKLRAGMPLGDMERTMWELGLLNAKTVRQLKARYAKRKSFAARMMDPGRTGGIEEDILEIEERSKATC